MLTYYVTVGKKAHIQMEVSKDMVHVKVKDRTTTFEGIVGIMGTYPHTGHGRVARDRQTVIQDVNNLVRNGKFAARIENSSNKSREPSSPKDALLPVTPMPRINVVFIKDPRTRRP
jgi:hypothetical protein